MRMLITASTLCLVAAGLAACGKPAPETRSPLPRAATAPEPSSPPPMTAGAASDASLPAAETVMTAPADTKIDPAAGRSNKAMTRAQESTAMPLPGQNNDHSAPLPAPKRASSP